MASTLAYSPVVSPHPTSSSMNQEHTLPTPAPEASASVKMHEMSLNDAPIATTPVLESVRLCKSTASFAASLHAPPDVITVASLPDTSMNDAENARKHIPSMPAFIKNFFMQERPESLLSTSHNAVADWCKMGLSKDIYKVVIQGLKDVVDTYGRQLNAAATIEPNMEFLSEILINWEHFTYRLARINYLFDRINSPYMIQHTSFTSVSDAGKHFYRERITSNLKITSCVVNSTVALLLQKRRAIIIDDDILKKMLCFIHDDFNAFIRPFQRIFSQQIRRYYKINAERAVIQLPIDQYLAFSYKQILRERAMCSELGRFVADIHPSPDHIAAQMYLFNHVQVIFQGFDSISRDAQLAVGLYKFALQFDEITMLQQMFADRVKQKFKGLMKFEPIQDYRQMVDDCIERVRGMYNLKLQLQMVVSSIFENDRQFVSTLNDALESVINQQSSRIASLLASFMDYTLNDLKVQPQLINKESEYHFIPALEIFRHLEAKDVFKVQFKHILVKQLIWTYHRLTLPLIHFLLDFMQDVCGENFTADLMIMVRDREKSDKFNQKSASSKILQVALLEDKYWPLKATQSKLRNKQPISPGNMSRFLKEFHQAYPHRTLSWAPAYGTCEVVGWFASGRIDLKLTERQSLLLNVFNDREITKMTCRDLSEKTKLTMSMIRKQMEPISSAHVQMFYYNLQTDTYTYNAQFRPPVPAISFLDALIPEDLRIESTDETERNLLCTNEDRMQAMILQVLKKKTTCSIQDISDYVQSKRILQFDISRRSDFLKSCLDELVRKGWITSKENEHYQYCP